ncbi:MAG: ornithine carbamoyltransferase [Thermoplasmata archaeon]|jgi:ornithine carbamoyltransferase|nr:MAG: ornithine carbamoyltransferase [Thermoplasmata archaeon]RLF64733.1 MAG: ornithine carbamoyltransferase [Thermoplasmata archaeon]
MKHLISMMDVKGHLEDIIDDAIDMKRNGYEKYLKDKILAMIFEKSSTRTRVSFESGMQKLGGHAIFLGKNDIQLGRGETIEDTALVLSRYVDIIMYRAYSHKDMMELAGHATVPVINGLDDEEHPCQVIADLMTVKEAKGKLEGLHLVYFGDGKNNMANSLMLGCTMAGMSITIVSPKEYWPSDFYVSKAREMGKVEITEMREGVAKNADIIVTDTWVSMGDEKEKEKRLNDFRGYTVNDSIMKEAKSDAIFMHCLPAYYGKEVTKEVAHGPQSVIFDEAENRMWAQMAIMKWLLKQ